MKKGAILIVFLASLILASGLVFAQSTNPWTADISGKEKRSFNADESIYLASYTVCFPPADNNISVYIVPTKLLGSGDKLEDVRGNASIIKTDKSGFIKTTKIWENTTGGNYLVVLDCNNNGEYDNEPTNYFNETGFSILEIGGAEVLAVEDDIKDEIFSYDSELGIKEVLMMKAAIKVANKEDIILNNIKLTASGSGEDFADVEKAMIYIDENSDGINNAGDLKLGEAGFDKDNGVASMSLNYTLVKGETKNIIITYVFKNFAKDKTYGFNISSMTGKGKDSANLIDFSGLPLASAVKTIGQEKLCKGDIKFSLTPISTFTNMPIVASVLGLQNCSGKKVDIKLNNCDEKESCSCTIQDSLCLCNFASPSTEGKYSVFACIDKNDDGKYTSGEMKSVEIEVKKLEGTIPTVNNANTTNTTNTQPVASKITRQAILKWARAHVITVMAIAMGIMFIILIIILIILIKLMMGKK